MSENKIEIRTEVIQIRVSLFEKNIIEQAAKKAGMKVSEYIRYCTMTYKAKEGDK